MNAIATEISQSKPVFRERHVPLVSFNARFMDQSMTGVQRYAHGMLANLAKNLRVIRPNRRLGSVEGHAWEQTILPFRTGSSLLWSPGNTGPLIKANQVVTVHDASTLDHPEWFSRSFATWYRTLLPRLARRVRKIITVSDFSKQRLMETCSIPSQKISVIYNAIHPRFEPVPVDPVILFRQRHHLERPYFLYVGSLEPRKNLSVLLNAWRRLSSLNCDLVLAGTPSRVFRNRGFVHLPDGVKLFGRVREWDLPVLLSGAKGFIFPSLYEGFGFPPLEAMACACPVLCSNTTSLPEVCGPAFNPADPLSNGSVLYFNPASEEELSDHIKNVIAMSPEIIERMTSNGVAWVKQFNWEKCAAQTWAVLEELLCES